MGKENIKTGFWDYITGGHTDTSPKPGDPDFIGPPSPIPTIDTGEKDMEIVKGLLKQRGKTLSD